MCIKDKTFPHAKSHYTALHKGRKPFHVKWMFHVKPLLVVKHETMILQVGVKILGRNSEGKWLLVRRSTEKYQYVKPSWDIPGGRITPGTPLLENLSREIMEETGLTLHGKPFLIAAQDIVRLPEKHIVRLTYIGSLMGEVKLDTAENTEFRWVEGKELEELTDLDEFLKEVVRNGVPHETKEGN